MTNTTIESNEEYVPPVKLRKTTNEEDDNDLYCFECHDEGDVICCDSCPRVYHPKCLGLIQLPEGDWTCPECKISQLPCQINKLPILLKYALRRMKSHPQATPFMRPVDPEQMPEYLDYIIHPMDLETMEKNIDLKKYSSTDAFLSDVKWITHNSVVFNGSQSKFTGVARAILKIARHEMIEIEICSECYLHSAQPSTPDWFAQPCTIPHTLCWAKMKGYQPWPAKVLRIVNDEVDVRFFGQHDRAWVSINNCFLLSKEYPGVEKKKSNINFEKSLSELQIHIDRLKELYGSFTYAPMQTPLSKTKPFKFVPIIDDSSLPTYVTVVNNNNSNTLRSTIKCSKQVPSPLPQQSTKRSNENSQDSQDTVKRVRLSSRLSDDNNTTTTNRIVLRIRKPSEDITTNRNESLNNSNNQITVQIKDPLEIVREEEDNDDDDDDNNDGPESDSQLSNVFDSLEQTSVPSPKDNQIPSVSPELSPILPSPAENEIEPSVSVKQESEETLLVIDPDAISVMSALIDAVESLEKISKISTPALSSSVNETKPVPIQFAERRQTVKHPRKASLQQRIITPQQQPPPPPPPTRSLPLPPLDLHVNEQSLSPTLPSAPLRPLSISPASINNYDETSPIYSNDLLTQYKQLERSSSFETLSMKSEPMDTAEPPKRKLNQLSTSTSSSSLATKSFLISPPANPPINKTKTSISSSSSSSSSTATPTAAAPVNTHFSAIVSNSNNNINNNFAPRTSSTVPQKTNWPPHLSKAVPATTQKRPGPPVIYPPTAQRNSNSSHSAMRMNPSSALLQPQSFEAFSINPTIAQRRPNGIPSIANTQSIPNRNPIRMSQFNTPPLRPSIDDHQSPAEVQLIIKTFNDKFQQLLTDFTVKIETALESNRIKYEKELEETRRTYRQSMNDLRTITTQQVQEMHNSLELQYWSRLSELRNRYESTTLYKSSKHFNGTRH